MEKGRVLIHAGLSKTGSTSIQLYLKRLSDREQSDFFYPTFRHPVTNKEVYNHSSPLLFAFANNHVGFENLRDSYREQLTAAIKKCQKKLLVLSGEGLSRLRTEELKELNDFIKDSFQCETSFKAVCFVRHPIKLLSSSVQQRVQRGETLDDAIKAFLKMSRNLYVPNLIRLHDVYGECLDIIQYESAIKNKDGLLGHFSEYLPYRNSRFGLAIKSNKSLCYEMVELFSYINEELPFFVNDQPSNIRKTGDLRPLFNIAGSKFQLPADMSRNVWNASSEPRKKLENLFGISFEQELLDIIEKKPRWSAETVKAVEDSIPSLSSEIATKVKEFLAAQGN